MSWKKLLSGVLVLTLLCLCTAAVSANEASLSDGLLIPKATEETAPASLSDGLLVPEAAEEIASASLSDGVINAMGYIDDNLDVGSVLASGWRPPMLLSAPSSYDLRDYNRVSSIKNQNPYGTCWAHAAAASAESNLLTDGLGEMDLSELQLVYFTYVRDSATAALNSGTAGDVVSHQGDILQDGGNSYNAISALANWLGLIPEDDLPYEHYAGTSDPNIKKVVDRKLEPAYAYDHNTVHLQNAYIISLQDSALVKERLMTLGAAAISYYHDDSYYNSSTAGYYQDVRSGTNHAVTLVGWDDNYAVSNFKSSCQPSKPGAWLCKNSWGPYWGDEGYFWISYYDKSISYVFFFDVSSANDYDYVYQYDGGLYNGSIHYDNTVIYGANVFSSERNETIDAVSFYIDDVNTSVDISIYTGLHDSPTSGDIAATQSFTAPYEGFYTVALNTPVTLASGTVFSVVLRVENSTLATLVSDYPYYSTSRPSSPVALAGQSYISFDGSSWSYAYADSKMVNLRIKAKTVAGSVSTVPGDVNNDGYATVSDAVQITRYIVGLISMSSGNRALADVYQDEVVDVKDITTMCKYVAGKVSSLPVIPPPATP